MRLTEEDIREFIEAYEAEFHETIPQAEAAEMADRVMQIIELVFRTRPKKPPGPCASA